MRYIACLMMLASSDPCAALEVAPPDLDAMLARFAQTGSRVEVVSARYAPEIEVSLRLEGEPTLARRYESERIARTAAAATDGATLSGRWVFVKSSATPTLERAKQVAAVAAAFAVETISDLAPLDEVAYTMKSIVYPAQVQFQGGGYVDLDRDQVGNYGFLHEMSGGPLRDAYTGRVHQDYALRLLPAGFNALEPVVNGYRWSVWVPDGFGRWIDSSAPIPALPDSTTWNTPHGNDSERAWICFAWPASASGDMLAIASTRWVDSRMQNPGRPDAVPTNLFRAPCRGVAPTPADLFGTAYDLDAACLWQPYHPDFDPPWLSPSTPAGQMRLAILSGVACLAFVLLLVLRRLRRRARPAALLDQRQHPE